MKTFKVHNFVVNKNLMPNQATTREIEISSDIGARFTLLALQGGTQKFYNFEKEVFEDGNTSKSNLSIETANKIFRSSIAFPLGGGSYVLKLLLNDNTTSHSGKKVISALIEKQSNDATVTFRPTTVNTSKFGTLPTNTSTGAIGDSNLFDFKWLVPTASTDAGGFGLLINTTVARSLSNFAAVEQLFYCSKTKAIASNPIGDSNDSEIVTVADTTGLALGMILYYHKATTTPVNADGAAVNNVYIVNIDAVNNTVSFSEQVAFENGETMTLRAYGPKVIYESSGFKFSVSPIKLLSKQLEIVVRADSNGTTVALTNTLGLSGGGVVTYKGLGVNQEGVNTVTSVNPDPGGSDGDGAMVVNLAQELRKGTRLTFENCVAQSEFIGSIKVITHPSVNTSIHFDLDKIITAGSAS